MIPRNARFPILERIMFGALDRYLVGTWGLVVTAAVGAVGIGVQADASRKALHAGQDALNSQKDIAANLKYEPINLEKLKADASAQAVANATQSLALERSLQPGVAAARQGAANRVASDLALGGNLSPDVANQVATAGRTIGGASGIGGNSTPLTAALIGRTADSVKNERLGNAFSLLSANPLPEAGLDPGSLASAEVAQNAAQNQFNLEKSGINSNLAASQGNLQAANAGANASMWSSILGLTGSLAGKYIGSQNKTPAVTPTVAATNPTFDFTSKIPSYSAEGLWGACWVAREVYGVDNPKWLVFRTWLLTQAPTWFRSLYLSHGEAFASWVKGYPRIKSLIRVWMDSRIHGY